MPSFKKLTFAPFFLISLAFLLFQLKANLGSYDLIFSISLETLKNLLIFSALISLSSFLFVLFISLSNDWRVILPIGIIAFILPPLVINLSLGLIISLGTAISLTIIFFTLSKKLKTYLNFEPASLLGPSIRGLAGLLILVFYFGYFFSINKVITEKGFQIPESLIDSAINLVPADTSSLLPQDVIKQTLQTQVQTMIKPYLSFVPAGLAVLFFILLQSLTSIINLLIHPLLFITFYILEKTKFISFTEEQRTVRKMVV